MKTSILLGQLKHLTFIPLLSEEIKFRENPANFTSQPQNSQTAKVCAKNFAKFVHLKWLLKEEHRILQIAFVVFFGLFVFITIVDWF